MGHHEFPRETRLKHEQKIIEEQEKLLKQYRNELDKINQQRSGEPTTRQVGLNVLRKIKQGIGNVAESLSSPNNARRMRIAQMPARRSDMDIVRQADLSNLKSPYYRNRDIRGRSLRLRR